LFQLYSTSAFPTAKIKNAFEMHFGPHLKRISNASPERLLKAFLTAFESISDRLRNAPEMRLWQCVLNPFEIRL